MLNEYDSSSLQLKHGWISWKQHITRPDAVCFESGGQLNILVCTHSVATLNSDIFEWTREPNIEKKFRFVPKGLYLSADIVGIVSFILSFHGGKMRQH